MSTTAKKSLAIVMGIAAIGLVVLLVWAAIAVNVKSVALRKQFNAVKVSAWLLTATPSDTPSARVLATDGSELSSWRFRQYLSDGPDPRPYIKEAWDSPLNSKFRKLSPSNFCFDNSTRANIFAVVGNGTAFDSELVRTWSEVPPNTIILLEIHGREVHWMQPLEVNVAEILEQANAAERTIGEWLGNSEEGTLVAFADGTVWRLSHETPIVTLTQFVDVKLSAKIDREAELGPYRLPLN